MRITPTRTYDQMEYLINNSSQNINSLSQSVASGKSMQSPSDNPSSWSQATSLQQKLTEYGTLNGNLSFAQNFGDATESTLTQLSNLITKAQNIATSSLNGSQSSATEQDANVNSLNQLLAEATNLVNTQYDGRYIFSVNGQASAAQSANIGVADTATNISANPGDAGTVLKINGQTAFTVPPGGMTLTQMAASINNLDTGATPTGVNASILQTSAGNYSLVLANDTPGTQPINLFGTTLTNGGTAVFSTDANGDANNLMPTTTPVSLTTNSSNTDFPNDVTAVNVNGIPITAANGAVTNATPSTGLMNNLNQQLTVRTSPSNQQTVNANGQAVLFGDPTQPQTNLLYQLYELKEAVKTGDTATIQTQAQNLDAAQNRIGSQTSLVGTQLASISDQQNLYTSITTDAQSQLSNLQDANMATVATELQQKQTAFQAAIEVTGMLDQNIADALNYL